MHLVGKPVFRFAIRSAALLLVLGLGQRVTAQDKDINRPPVLSDGGGAIPVRVIDGRLVVSCDISGTRLRVPVNLWFDFDGAYGLQLHNRAAAPLPAETPNGRPSPLTLHFPDFTIGIARRELGPEEAFEKYTKYHSKEIGEDALVGAIGSHILKHFDVVFDLPRGQISLLPIGGLANHETGASLDEIVTPVTLQNDLVWLPVSLQGRSAPIRRALAIGSSRYDTLVDRRLCNSLQRPAGNIGPLHCESIDFAPYVAFRPADVVQVHSDGVAGVLGINLLEHFRVYVDRQSLLVTLQSAGSPSFPKEELAWFQAVVAEDSQLVLDWLKDHSQTRLGREAAEFLLSLLLDDGAEEDQLAQAVQWVNDTMPKNLRATRLFDLMEELVNEGEEALGISAGTLGLKSARADRYPESNYKLHGRLGELLLPRDNREAWRHLLSAAFGLPEDGMINLNLGRCYEADGKKKRAFSRYVQALVKEESSELAMIALARLDSELPADQRLTIETIDRMISGRVRNYSAPTMYEADPDTRSERTSLVEFFTNAYVGDERAGAIGGALGNQGALTHFADTDCVFLSYHLPAPRIEPGVGRYRQGEKIYEAIRDVVADQLKQPTKIQIEAKGTVRKGRVAGQVVIQGPPPNADDLSSGLVIQVVIAERGVVFHGSSGVVIHRMVARGLATEGSLDGVRYTPDANGRCEITFGRELTELVTNNKVHLDSLAKGKASGNTRIGLRIDPKSVEIVVVVREVISGKVAQASKCHLERVEASAE